MYHSPCERSEFYSMSDLSKPPILFTPEDDNDKVLSYSSQSLILLDTNYCNGS